VESQGDQQKESKVERHVACTEEMRYTYKKFGDKTRKERIHLGDLSVNGRIILKCILE
jgi:hypothetical protein